MIPVFECLQGACIAGVAWNPEMLAAFLAWWMPLNLISYLAMLALVPLLIHGSKWKAEAFTLRQFLLMTMIFWAFAVGTVAYVLVIHWLEKRERKKKETKGGYVIKRHWTEDI